MSEGMEISLKSEEKRGKGGRGESERYRKNGRGALLGGGSLIFISGVEEPP